MIASVAITNKIIENIRNGTGPCNQNIPFPCGLCDKNVNQNQKAVLCDQCGKWIHIKCDNISNSDFEILKVEPDNKRLTCIKCTIINN